MAESGESGEMGGGGSGVGGESGSMSGFEFPTVDDAAVSLNELYRGYLGAGFTRAEALWICGCVIKGLPLPDGWDERVNGDSNE